MQSWFASDMTKLFSQNSKIGLQIRFTLRYTFSLIPEQVSQKVPFKHHKGGTLVFDSPRHHPKNITCLIKLAHIMV